MGGSAGPPPPLDAEVPGDAGTPWHAILLILLIQFIEALTTYVFLPVVPFFAEHLQPGAAPAALGWAAGQLTGCFYAGAVFGTPFWGLVSDRMGRRPVLLAGLLLPQLCLLALAFVPSLRWALALRLLQGLAGANISLTKTVMGEVCHSKAALARGMSLLMLPFSVAQAVGPAAAGALVNPAAHIHWLDTALLRLHPFLLTLAVPLAVSLTALPLLLARLPETHPRAAAPATDQTRLTESRSLAASGGQEGRLHQLLTAIASLGGGLSIILYAIAGGVFYAYLTVIPLWLKLDPGHGGFGMDSRGTGLVMASAGPVLFLTQPLLAPYLVQRWGARRAWTVQAAGWAALLWLSPFATQAHLSVGALCVLWTLNNVLYQMLLSGCFIMQSNAVPASVRGAFIGVGTALTAVGRLVMPALAAPLFTRAVAEPSAWLGGHHLAFNALAFVVACAAVLSLAVPPSVDQP
eukprot:EG_transcript_9311